MTPTPAEIAEALKDECPCCSGILASALRAAEAREAESLERFPNSQCPSCGYPKEDPIEGYVGMKSRAEKAESENAVLRKDLADNACGSDCVKLAGENATLSKRLEELDALRSEANLDNAALKSRLALAVAVVDLAQNFIDVLEIETSGPCETALREALVAYDAPGGGS